MKTLNRYILNHMLILIVFVSLLSSCKKSSDAKLPTISFKTGGNYTSSNATVTTSDIINVGITADKNESDLRSFTVSYAYGSDVFTLKNTYYVPEGGKSHFEKDYTIKPENVNGFETWKFEITDFDGNTNSVSFKLTVK
jgi:hypothetical protein